MTLAVDEVRSSVFVNILFVVFIGIVIIGISVYISKAYGELGIKEIKDEPREKEHEEETSSGDEDEHDEKTPVVPPMTGKNGRTHHKKHIKK